ncbi:MAG TPA: hypothetical protein VIH28_11405 [Ignavibacteriaceae bacterium]|nr:MAG: hypothetical protein A2W11_04215 [Ignavibacteria bacterium RBG_16_35_7]
MKKIFVVLFISMAAFWGCSPISETSLTLKNLAAGAVYLNFRGEVTTVPAGKTVVLSDLSKGTYAYVTTYAVPAGTTTSTEVGELEGELIIKAGSKILILYSSTFSLDTYTIYASKTSNDDLSDTGSNPLFP